MMNLYRITAPLHADEWLSLCEAQNKNVCQVAAGEISYVVARSFQTFPTLDQWSVNVEDVDQPLIRRCMYGTVSLDLCQSKINSLHWRGSLGYSVVFVQLYYCIDLLVQLLIPTVYFSSS